MQIKYALFSQDNHSLKVMAVWLVGKVSGTLLHLDLCIACASLNVLNIDSPMPGLAIRSRFCLQVCDGYWNGANHVVLRNLKTKPKICVKSKKINAKDNNEIITQKYKPLYKMGSCTAADGDMTNRSMAPSWKLVSTGSSLVGNSLAGSECLLKSRVKH